MISPQHQTFEQWQRSPIQGAMPSPTPAYFHNLLEDLVLAESHLEAAYSLNPVLESSTPKLAQALADALTSCQLALGILNDLPSYSINPESVND